MKHLYGLLLIMCLSVTSLFAQQDTQYSLYHLNTLAINPAFAGNNDVISVTAIYRNQWLNVEGAPQTFAASIHSNVGLRNGLGLYAENDQIGVHNRLNIMGSYAFRAINADKVKLSLGIQGGVLQYTSNWDELPNIQDTDDPNFQNNRQSRLIPNFGLGIYLNTQSFYIGFSIPHLLNSSLDDVQRLSVYERHYFLTSGFIIKVAPIFKIKPTAIVKSVPAQAPISVELNSQFIFNDRFWFGGGYRIGSDAMLQAGLFLPNNGLKIAYSYGINTSELSVYNAGSHEIMLGWDINPNKQEKVMSPRFFD